eukprot:scaffold143720_cov18-Tisochrysis_lutea.AAC.1
MLSLMLMPSASSSSVMAGNQGGQASDSTCSLPGNKQRGEVLPGVLCREQEVKQDVMQHHPSGRDSQVLGRQ